MRTTTTVWVRRIAVIAVSIAAGVLFGSGVSSAAPAHRHAQADITWTAQSAVAQDITWT